jgi:phage gp29-like protein
MKGVRIGRQYPSKHIANKTTKRTAAAAPASDLLTSLMNNLPVDQEWLDHDEMRRITRDGTVIAAFGSRKAATLKKELLIDTKDEKLKLAIEKSFGYKTLRKILDTPMQGCAVFELNWTDDGLWRPELVERNYRTFVVEKGVLKFARYGMSEEIPPYKVLYNTYEEKFDRPMGTPIAEALFWPVKFKNASLEFWVKFLEKYGTPWAIGKTSGDKDDMADELYAMLGGDSAVIDEEDSIEITQIQKAGDFDKIAEYCDNQIRSIILGGNLTSEVKGGSFAAAGVHNDIREDIAMADENLTLDLIREAARMIKEINNISADVTVILKDKDDPNIELAKRDKSISEMGWTPTQEYIEKTYNITVEKTAAIPVANRTAPGRVFAFSKEKPADSVDAGLKEVNMEKIALSFQNQIEKMLDEASTFEEVIDSLQAAYPKMELNELQELLENVMADAEILGYAEIEEESDA